VFGLAAVAAAGAASIAMLIGTTNSGGPTPANAAILHHTLRAVTPPPNTILHVKVVGGRDGTQFSGETWQQTAAPYASRGMKGPVGSQEFAENGTTSFLYDPSTNTIYERPDSSPPTFVDPVASLRQALNNGSAHVEGTVVIAGESLYKIELPKGLVGYFDTST
jgi:hypothetical protein